MDGTALCPDVCEQRLGVRWVKEKLKRYMGHEEAITIYLEARRVVRVKKIHNKNLLSPHYARLPSVAVLVA